MVNLLLTSFVRVNILCICRIEVRSTGDEHEESVAEQRPLELAPWLWLEQRRLQRLIKGGRFPAAVFQTKFQRLSKASVKYRALSCVRVLCPSAVLGGAPSRPFEGVARCWDLPITRPESLTNASRWKSAIRVASALTCSANPPRPSMSKRRAAACTT